MLGLGDEPPEANTLGIGTVLVEARYSKLKQETSIYLKQVAVNVYIICSDKVDLPPSLCIVIYRKQPIKFWSIKIIAESDREFELRAMVIYNKAVNKYIAEQDFKPRIL